MPNCPHPYNARCDERKDSMTQLERFCKTHHACAEGLDWAVGAGCATPAEAWAKCQRSDWMIWMLRAQGKLDTRGWACVAVEMAADVLDIYEARYPDNIEARRAIDRARAWVSDPTEENLEVCRQSRSAAAAAYATAAAAAAARARAKKSSEQADLLRRLLGNPFEEETP